MGIWEEKHTDHRMFLPNVYRICRKQISNFLLEDHVLCLGKRSSLRSFFPRSLFCCHLCRGTFSIPMETGQGTQFASLQRTLSIKLPRGFGFSQSRQWHFGIWAALGHLDQLLPAVFPPRTPRFSLPEVPLQDRKQLLFFLWNNGDTCLQPLLPVYLITFSPWIFLTNPGPGGDNVFHQIWRK